MDQPHGAHAAAIHAAIKDRDIAARTAGRDPLGDDEIQQLLSKMIKQREESLRLYEEAGRMDLADQEREEVAIIRSFLPRQMSDDEVHTACRDVVHELGAASLRDMGRTMAALKERYPGQMDFGRASALVKEMLGQ